MSRDYERPPAHTEAMIKWAMIGLMVRRLAPAPAVARGSRRPRPEPFLNTLSERTLSVALHLAAGIVVSGTGGALLIQTATTVGWTGR